MAHPLDEFFRGGHGGQAALADEGPIAKLSGFFDFRERGGRIEAAGEG